MMKKLATPYLRNIDSIQQNGLQSKYTNPAIPWILIPKFLEQNLIVQDGPDCAFETSVLD